MTENSYSRDYSAYENTKKIAYTKNVSLYKWATRFLPLPLLKQLFPVIGYLEVANGASVFDIGAGSGLYSHILRQRFGCHCTELEPHLNNLYGAQQYVIKSDINTMPHDSSFDVILLIDILEHLQPEVVCVLLEKLKSMMQSNGSIYIKTPNTSSIAGLESSFGDLTHIQHLNSISLSTLAINNGYIVRRISGIGPNLNPTRMLMRAISLPFEALLLAHLKAQGCSGILTKPSIIIELKKCK